MSNKCLLEWRRGGGKERRKKKRKEWGNRGGREGKREGRKVSNTIFYWGGQSRILTKVS